MRGAIKWLWPGLLLLAMVAVAAPASGQVFTGRIEVTVADASGAVIPGVTVEVTGPQKVTFVTGPDGVARFLNLEPGTYQVRATIQGFQEYQNTNVPVVAGGTLPLRISLKVAGVEEQIQVTAQSPVIDTKKSGTSTAVTLEELQNIPSSRDPWVVMQTVPGIIVDRVNVGGSESGQQSGYQAKGASTADATWNMDGIPITDMSAVGSTPTYYDFDMFQEMNVTTGGSDMGSSTGGVHLNFILKSGSNMWHGSARTYFENESMQSNNMDPTLATDLGSPNGKGNRTSQYADYGFELGGPLVKDRLWAWGSLGKTDVRILTIKQTPDRTILKNRAFKAQAQLSSNIRAGFTYFFGDKNKFGRNASATRPPETTYNQTGPSSFYKGEVNFVLGSNLFLTARASDFPTGFSFQPQGGMDKQVWRDDSRVWHGSYGNYITDRPQQVAMAEGNYFRGSHELRFGFSYRRVTVDSTSQWSGNGIVTRWRTYPNMRAYVYSPWAAAERAHYYAGWIGDAITTNRMTLNLGLRFDKQDDGTLAVSEPAVPGFEEFLPEISAQPVPAAIKWNAVSPRISVSYALNQARTTLVRGSYALFASQLPNGTSSWISVVQYRYMVFNAVDTNGDGIAQQSEFVGDPVTVYGFDPANPSSLTTINRIGDYNVPKTHEIIFGVDHELMPNFGVSASFTWRKMVDFNWVPYIGVRRPMYNVAGLIAGGPLPDGSSYSVPWYAVDESLLSEAALAGGREYVAQSGYHQRFIGFEVQATKRMSNHWMARFGFSTNKHQEFFDNPDTSIQDPTPGPSNPYVNGGLVVVASGGSGKSGIYQLLPKYQFSANGLYQAPYGIDLGFNMVLRQGFGQPWYMGSVDGDYFAADHSVLLVSDVGKNRLPTVTTLDFRLGKSFKVNRATINFDLDIFNLLNTGTVLGRQYDASATGALGFNQVLEIVNPRIMRLGLRFNF